MNPFDEYDEKTKSDVEWIIKALLSCVAKEQRTITYKGLEDLIVDQGGPRIHWRNFGGQLDALQAVCQEHETPCLSVMVITQATGKPGDGFAGSYKEHFPQYAGTEEDELLKAEQERIRNFKGWPKFLADCGINDFTFDFVPATPVSEDRAKEYLEFISLKEYVLVAEQRRNRAAREECIRKQGAKCAICDFTSEEKYGIPGIIEVHHKDPVADMKVNDSRNIDPEVDLVPLCPNCHAIVHSKKRTSKGGYTAEDVYTIEEVKAMYEAAKKAN